MTDNTLRDRINEAMNRVGKMCSEGRPPRMSIPVSPNDDDTFINDTLRKCRAALADGAKQPWVEPGGKTGMFTFSGGRDSADAPIAAVATERLRALSLLSAFFLDDIEEGWPADVVVVLRRYSGASDSADIEIHVGELLPRLGEGGTPYPKASADAPEERTPEERT